MAYYWLVEKIHTFVSIVAMEVQIGMTLDVAGEEVAGPEKVVMVNVSNEIKSHVKCFKCGEFGHYRDECPKWEKEEANLIEDESAIF